MILSPLSCLILECSIDWQHRVFFRTIRLLCGLVDSLPQPFYIFLQALKLQLKVLQSFACRIIFLIGLDMPRMGEMDGYSVGVQLFAEQDGSRF
jgi:hypothetical protein